MLEPDPRHPDVKQERHAALALGKPLTGDRGLPAIIRAISADVVTGDSRRFSPGDLEMRLKIVTGDNRRFLT